MTRSQTKTRISRRGKTQRIPLANLRISEAVRTVVAHPRRLGELARMLEDRDLMMRGRAADALARLAESRADRLVRITERMKGGLSDDSAYVRWHLVYAFGRLGLRFPGRAPDFVPKLAACLDDPNQVVRSFAMKALADLAARHPKAVLDAFSSAKVEPPSPLARILCNPGRKNEKLRSPRK